MAVFGVGGFSLLNAIDVVADPPKFASAVEASVGLCHFEASSIPGRGGWWEIPRCIDQYFEVKKNNNYDNNIIHLYTSSECAGMVVDIQY